ncbi:MAG: hypothetical protein ACI4JI_07265 [Ruminiclostridium sp.]
MKKYLYILVAAIILVLSTACAHEHEYADATCTEPKTCTICGETDGEALGHSVSIGICDKCKEFVCKSDFQELTELFDKMSEIDEKTMDYYSEFDSYSSRSNLEGMYKSLKKIAEYTQDQQNELAKFANIISKHDDLLSLMRDDMIVALETDIIIPKSSESGELLDSLLSLQDYSVAYSNILSEWLSWTSKNKDVSDNTSSFES